MDSELLSIQWMMQPLFQDRREAGRLLAASLTDFSHRKSCVVVGLQAGAVPVGLEVAHALTLPLERYPVTAHIVEKKCVLLVSEGILCANGIGKAISELQGLGARRIVLASPVITRDALTELWPLASDICYLMSPERPVDLSELYDRLPEYPEREADELIRMHRNQQYLEPSEAGLDGVQLRLARDGACGHGHGGNSRTFTTRFRLDRGSHPRH